MKIKLVAVVIFLVGYFNVTAQEYVPLLDSYNEWKLSVCFFGCLTDTYYTNGDTLVDGTSYKILDGYHYISRSFLLREDVAEKKVYTKIYLPSEELNYLLYDFSLEVGDSFEMFNPATPFPREGGMFDLDSIINRTLVDGNDYRHFYFSPSAGNTASTENAVWIEGVGSLSILTAPGGAPDINGVGHLSCFYKSGTHVYENLDSITKCERAILSVHDIKKELWNVNIYTSGDAVEIINASDVENITVYSITGRKVAEMSNDTNTANLSLPTSDLSEGLYILKASDALGRAKTFKFLVK